MKTVVSYENVSSDGEGRRPLTRNPEPGTRISWSIHHNLGVEPDILRQNEQTMGMDHD